MNIVMDRKTLLDALNKVSTVIPSNSPMPVIQGVLIVADEKVTFIGTDLEKTMYVEKTAQVEEKGSIVIPLKQFQSAVSKFTADEVKIKVKENAAKITCGTAKMNLSGYVMEDFPQNPLPECPSVFGMKDTEFCRMLKLVSFCVTENETREALRHILFKLNEKKFSCVSTDGRRLALYDKQIEIVETMEVLIPSETLADLRKILKVEDKQITMKYGESAVIFEIDDVVLVSKICTGKFPDFEKVIPSDKDLDKKVVIDRAKLLSAIELVIVALKNNMVIEMTFAEDKLTVSGIESDADGSEIVPLDYKEQQYVIKFNPKYLLEVLRNMDEKEITMKFNSSMPIAPAMVTNEKEYRYVVMPLK